ncbi:hypothetical protein CCUS01_17114 [Colletotrichum cuscutae]|uniref:Uncharacterized protein n=1 Tax=Colletotrichum cuscutae TaxID=1209917 RepID=A0AAI9VAM2_9PEZI|nr:hypothetical protein CCUS01_17114 [Colletotrichum cuscutae]
MREASDGYCVMQVFLSAFPAPTNGALRLAKRLIFLFPTCRAKTQATGRQRHVSETLRAHSSGKMNSYSEKVQTPAISQESISNLKLFSSFSLQGPRMRFGFRAQTFAEDRPQLGTGGWRIVATD